MAKQIIAEEKKILVPPKNISMEEAGIFDIPHDIECRIPPYQLHKTRFVIAENVKLEEHLPGFTPDVLIETNHGELLVEIFVSHRVNDSKRKKAAEHGSAMLEINLSEFVDTPVKQDEIKSVILSSDSNKEWIHYPLSNETLNKAKHYYDNHDAVKKHRAYILAEKRKREKAESDRTRRNQKIKDLFQPENYATALERLRNDDAFLTMCEKWHKDHWFSFAQHYRQHKEVPFFIDIPITGEMIFKCDRRIWQSIIFNRYIYGRKEDGARINVKGIFDALKDDYNIEIDYDLTYRLPHPKDEKDIWLREDVVCKYMDHLEDIGFISSSFEDTHEDWRTVQVRRTINPPLSDEANNLSSAIQSVNSRSPDIDVLIRQKTIEYYNEQQKNELEESQKHTEEHELKREEKTRSQSPFQPRVDDQARQEIRRILKAKINRQTKPEESECRSDSNYGKDQVPTQNYLLHGQSEGAHFKNPYHEGKKALAPQLEPITSDQRIWYCNQCGKKATKKAFSEFINKEDKIGVCTMCFHLSRQRNRNY